MNHDRFHGMYLQRRFSVTARLVFGLIVITLGILFTMDNLGLIDASQILRWWPALLVAYGMTRLLGLGSHPSCVVGSIFVAVGGWLILGELGVIHLGLWDLWPLGLVFLGISLVMRSMGGIRGGGGASGAEGAEDAASRLNAFAMWASLERKVVSQDFQGGDITAIMAGHEIDLRGAQMTRGSAVIDMLVIMGGVDLRVPEGWKVSSEAMLIMGGLEDHSRRPAGEVTGHLILRGVVLMGGIEVKN